MTWNNQQAEDQESDSITMILYQIYRWEWYSLVDRSALPLHTSVEYVSWYQVEPRARLTTVDEVPNLIDETHLDQGSMNADRFTAEWVLQLFQSDGIGWIIVNIQAEKLKGQGRQVLFKSDKVLSDSLDLHQQIFSFVWHWDSLRRSSVYHEPICLLSNVSNLHWFSMSKGRALLRRTFELKSSSLTNTGKRPTGPGTFDVFTFNTFVFDFAVGSSCDAVKDCSRERRTCCMGSVLVIDWREDCDATGFGSDLTDWVVGRVSVVISVRSTFRGERSFDISCSISSRLKLWSWSLVVLCLPQSILLIDADMINSI